MKYLTVCICLGMLVLEGAMASSHMDAPAITLDPAANTTDVYAFVSDIDGQKYLTTALAVYPHQEPGIGPNHFAFLNEDAGRYAIHITDPQSGSIRFSYEFIFSDQFRTDATILQNYLGVVQEVADESQNFVQRYRVVRVDRSTGARDLLGVGVVPPNNQGIATPFYNQNDDGEAPARGGVAAESSLDRYTRGSIARFADGQIAFAGQRDDGFYADIQSIFDLLQLRSGEDRFDSQAGFNVHTMVLAIPVDELGGEMQQVGVFAATYRFVDSIVVDDQGQTRSRILEQVGRQGNPLFNEALVAVGMSDLYNTTLPVSDDRLFRQFAETPELAALINALVFGGEQVAATSGRDDLAGIFIPDVIRVDLSTPPARLAGNGPSDPANPDDDGFSSLSVFGGDTLPSQLTGGEVAGGWPNGRRFGDDVVDIAVSAIVGMAVPGIDNVNRNDIGFHTVFPYASTPQNGRNHDHDADDQG